MATTRTAKKSAADVDGKAAYATPALEKGLDVLELLAHESDGLTKSEISRRLNRTVSEIFRMLLCLERRGYIAQSDGDRYALTLKLFKLVQEHPPTERLITEALPLMHRVTHATQQSCHMGIIEGAQVTILAQVNAPTPVGFYVKLGSTVDLMEATTGYVILAHLDAAQRARILEEWSHNTGKSVPADLNKHLARILRQGYEKSPSYKVRGILNISYPIFDERGSALGALTVPYIQHNEATMDTQAVGQALKTATDEITHLIGGVVPKARGR